MEEENQNKEAANVERKGSTRSGYIAAIVVLSAVVIGVSVALIVETTKFNGICQYPPDIPANSYSSWKSYEDRNIEVICANMYRFSDGSYSVNLRCDGSGWNTTMVPECISIYEAVNYICHYKDEELGYNVSLTFKKDEETSGEGSVSGLRPGSLDMIAFNSSYCWPTEDSPGAKSLSRLEKSLVFPVVKVNVSDIFDIKIRSQSNLFTVVTFEQQLDGLEYIGDVFSF